MRLFRFLLCLILPASVGLTPPLAAEAVATQAVDIAAQKQSFDEQGITTFTGNVKVKYQDIRITGDRAALELGETGKPDVAVFYDRPHAWRETSEGRDLLDADTIKIYMTQNKMLAEGNTNSLVVSASKDPVFIVADRQEFNNETKQVTALGNVQVDYETTQIFSPKAVLWVDDGGKAKQVVFSGGSKAKRENGIITSEKLTIMAASGNLLAENKVESIFEPEPKPGEVQEKVVIQSAFQQYDNQSQTMLASGNVRIFYSDYKAFGPKATFKMKSGQVESIILTGRGKIITSTRQVIADKIVITTDPKHFDALGNVKSKFITENTTASDTSASENNSQVPSKARNSNMEQQPPSVNQETEIDTSEQRPTDDYIQ